MASCKQYSESLGLKVLQASPGNDKLGRCPVLNRAVGVTCPVTCPYLTGIGIPRQCKCYAEHTEDRFEHSKRIGRHNTNKRERQDLVTLFRCGRDVRLHERGDFYFKGRIDRGYVRDVRHALKKRTNRVWTYTHGYAKELARLQDDGLNIYASCHSKSDIDLAFRKGFKLIALVLPERTPGVCKSALRGLKPYDGGAWIKCHGLTLLVCPAQRKKNVTCDRCKWCIQGSGHVAFLQH